jgi:hypothetical protein
MMSRIVQLGGSGTSRNPSNEVVDPGLERLPIIGHRKHEVGEAAVD